MPDEPRLASESIAGLRPYQEDSVLVTKLSDERVLVAVADGMGGHAAGEVASALALETLVEALEEGQGIDKAFALANRRVFEQAQDPGKQGMGTTLTAALVEDGEYMIANVGDSRGYLLSETGIRQVTEDHSFVAEAMKRGQTEEEAMDTPWKDALTRSIGTDANVEVDVFGPFPVQDDTALIICSDGLYKTLSDDDLRRIFVESGTPRGAAQTLVSAALENGSDDNISVAIAEYGEVPRVQGQATVTIAFDPSAVPDDPGPVATSEATDQDAEASGAEAAGAGDHAATHDEASTSAGPPGAEVSAAAGNADASATSADGGALTTKVVGGVVALIVVWLLYGLIFG